MRKIGEVILFLAAMGSAACAMLVRTPPVPGDTRAAVIAKYGTPTASYPLGTGEELEFASGPSGQFTWMATLGADGRLVKFEQVLTGEQFARIKIGTTTKAEVLRLVGRPAQHSRVMQHDYEVWSYRYKENGVWNSLMHVHFDQAGVVELMLNGPDPEYEEKHRR